MDCGFCIMILPRIIYDKFPSYTWAGNEHFDIIDFRRWQQDYEKWKKTAGSTDDIPLDELGQKLYTSKGCNACHSIDGSPKIGPTWKGVYGTNRELTTGENVLIDENYVRESIVYSANKISKGYQNVMPSYAGLLSDREITALVEYIKSLK